MELKMNGGGRMEDRVNKIIIGDAIQEMEKLDENSIDAIITDPPYQLGFMGKAWDKNEVTFKASTWKACLRVLKYGGFLLAFGGTRTYHRLVCGIEDAGFEIRDTILWVYASGFPKSLNVGKQIDKMKGAEREIIGVYEHPQRKNRSRQPTGEFKVDTGNPRLKKEPNYLTSPATSEAKEWEGWGTALKPACELIVVARKPLSEKNVALNVLKWGTGGINIDACRVEYCSQKDYERTKVGFKEGEIQEGDGDNFMRSGSGLLTNNGFSLTGENGRFPANLILECTCDKVKIGEPANKPWGGNSKKDYHNKGIFTHGGGFIDNEKLRNEKCIIHIDPNCPCYILDKQSGKLEISGRVNRKKHNVKTPPFRGFSNDEKTNWKPLCNEYFDMGGASRFFYIAKASKSERNFGLENSDIKEKNIRYEDGRSRSLEIFSNSYTEKSGNPCKRGKTPKMKNSHPTVKPVKLIEYLIKLVTRENAIVLDPFIGSGTTAIACLKLSRRFIGIEKEEEYVKIANARIKPFLEQTKIFGYKEKEVKDGGQQEQNDL